MSKKNQTFRTLGQRMQLFGRGILRNYSGEQPVQLAPAEPSRPRGQWRSMSNNNLIWRQEQLPQVQMPNPPMESVDYSDFNGGDFQDQPVQHRPQPGQAPRRERPQGQNPVQREPRNQPPANTGPNYVQTEQGTPVQVSRKQFSSPLQRRLEAILDAHAARDAERDQVREHRREVVVRKESDGDNGSIRRRRRGNLSVDYVETTSLLPPEERAKAAQAQAMDSSETAESTERSSSSESQSDADDDDDSDSEWFDGVPDDDDDIDDIAGFEAQSHDASGIQRSPDLSLDADDMTYDEGDVDNDDMGEFDSGESYPSQNLPSNDQPTIERDFDDSWDEPQQPTTDYPSMPPNPTAHIQRAPMLDFDLPEFDENDYSDDETVPLIPQYRNPESPSQTDSPIQRQVNDLDDVDESYDADADMDADFGENFPSSSQNPPIQRAPRIDPPTDQSNQPRIPWDVTPNRSKSPLQRLPRFDEEEDISDLDTEKTDFSQDFNDVSGSEPSIQRTSLPRNDYEDADFEEYNENDFDADDSWQADMPDTGFTPTDTTTVQRSPMQSNEVDEAYQVDDYEDADFEEYNENDFDADDSWQADMPDTGFTPTDTTPVQRTPIQRDQDSDLVDDDHFDNVDSDFSVEPTTGQSPSGDSPIQRAPLPYEEVGEIENVDFDDSDDDDWNSDNANNHASDMRQAPANIQRDLDADYSDDFDENFDEYADFDNNGIIDNTPTFNPSQLENRNIQREAFTPDVDAYQDEEQYADEADDGYDAGDQSPVQREAFTPDVDAYQDEEQYADEADYGYDAGDFTQSTADQSPVQRRYDEDFGEFDDADDHTDYDVYGDDSYGDSDYRAPSPDSPIQRSAYEADDYYLDDDFDHLEDTDGMTAMNILEDYLSTREMPPVSNNLSGVTSPQTPVQREYQEDYSGYNDDPDALTDSQEFNLAGSFDPTPTASNNIQRTPQSDNDQNYRYDDYDDDSNDSPSQGMDLYQAMSQAGMVPPPSSQPPIQRYYDDSDDDNYSYDENAHSDYDDYGDATWAQLNNYAPATNAPANDNTPVQRRPQIDDNDDDVSYQTDDASHNMQDIDLHQAMAQIGMAPPPSNPRPINTPIQRSPQVDYTQDQGSQDEENFVNSQAMDLYEAMMGSGMISKSEPAPAPPPPPSIQRKASSQKKSVTDAMEEAGLMSASVSNANSGEPMDVVQRVAANTPVATSEEGDTGNENENDSEKDDQEYLSQLARDVYRIIKDKLRIENERRGR